MTSNARTNHPAKGLTVAVVGCGKLGTAIIQGLLRSINDPNEDGKYSYPVTQIIASIRSEDTLIPLQAKLQDEKDGINTSPGHHVAYVIDDNVEAIRQSNVIFLSCHPNQARTCLRGPGTQEAIAGKLIISMLGGVSIGTLEDAVYPGSRSPLPGQTPCQIIQTITNTAAARGQAISAIAEQSDSVTQATTTLCEDILSRLGQVAHVAPQQMSTTTALCASGTAFFTWFLAAMVEGATKQGIDKDKATQLAALTMAGAANAVIQGEDPDAIISRVTTPGGVTAAGLKVLEENRASDPIVDALLATSSRLRLVDELLVELN